MTLAVTAIGAMFCGFLSNHIDIAPNFAGTLVALTNTVATIPGITVPFAVSALTEKDVSIYHSYKTRSVQPDVIFYRILLALGGLFSGSQWHCMQSNLPYLQYLDLVKSKNGINLIKMGKINR